MEYILYRLSSSKFSKFPVWFNKTLIKLINQKEKLRIRYHKFHNPRDKIELDLLRERCHKFINICQKQYHNKIEANICKNSKLFWRYIKDKRKGQSTFPTKMKMNNITATTGPDIANLFASQFSSVYSSNEPTNSKYVPITNNHIFKIKVNESEVSMAIKRLNIDKGSGPDNIPPLFIKRCRTAITLPLTIIFNRSLQDGVFPTEWKKTRILPIFKNHDQKDVKNYRPISILSCLSKLFESLLYPHIFTHIKNYLTEFQHGFYKGRSVETNLVLAVSDIAREIDNGEQVDTIYTDFSNAFDKVNHVVLLNKLAVFGIEGSLLSWFKSYLFQRPQEVVINGFQSKQYYAESGVPQGSHLGPVLFLIFINDITSYIKYSKISLFADDLKIYRTIKSIHDAELLQKDLDGVGEWCTLNGMLLNTNKCSYIRFTRKIKPIESRYSLNGEKLVVVSEVRDLGVLLDSKLKFNVHINNIVTRAAQMLGFLKRSLKGFKLRQTRLILYNSLVRSRLEFASVSWNPVYSSSSQRIENIQRAFTRHLAYITRNISHRRPYSQRMSFFNITSLKTRRMIADLMFIHKILNNKIHCADLLSSLQLTVPLNYPRHPITRTFSLPRCRTNLGLHQPLARISASYNEINAKLPEIDIVYDNSNSYRNKLLKHFVQQSYEH